jgi:hypothetical protein
MQLNTFTHAPAHGWSTPLPKDLDGTQTWVLAFGSADLCVPGQPMAAALAELRSAFPTSHLLGCSSAGEIYGTRVRDGSIAVAAMRFEHTRLRRADAVIAGSADSAAAGARLAQELAPHDGLRAVFVLSDGLRVNGAALVAGLSAHLPRDVVITGGLAGDGSRFKRTWVLSGGLPHVDHVVALGLYGERVVVAHGCDGGWSDFGPERRITRSQGNVLHELDGQPALDLYKTYLGERASGLPGTALLFPLAVRAREGAQPVVRTILSVDEAERSMTFAGDIPQGGVARLMRSSTERLIDSAGAAGDVAREQAGAWRDDALAISISCVGRRLVLGERTEEEAEAVLDGAPARLSQIGFYSYGEIAPPLPGRAAELHNQSMTVSLVAER